MPRIGQDLAEKLLAKLDQLADLMAEHSCDSEDPDACIPVAHDEDHGRCCSPGEPMSCAICEARALVMEARGEEIDG